MKLIDVLNKIANGEEVPKIILFNSYKYKFDKKNNEYRRLIYDGTLGGTLGTINVLDKCLNDEVKIIEEDKPKTLNDIRESYGLPRIEDKKIEKLKIEQDTPNSNFYIRNENGTKCGLTKHSKIMADKINEIIDYLNKEK